MRDAVGWLLGALLTISACSTPAAKPEILGETFSKFVASVEDVQGPESAALVDRFLAAISTTPLTDDDSVATFLFRGEATTVIVIGDANGWTPDDTRMTRLGDTDLWYYQALFEPDARLDYKFVVDGADWILDPLNPNEVSSGFGSNSELAMPRYDRPDEIIDRAQTPRGDFLKFSITSQVLGNTREITVYTPPSYDTSSDSLGVALFHDGPDWLAYGSTEIILNNLIADAEIQPIIAVFVPPVDRMAEYGFERSGDYERFVVDELMPEIDRRFRTRKDPRHRANMGVSLGGLISTQITYRNPDEFGLAASFSTSYWINDEALIEEILAGPAMPVRFYLDWGAYEPTIQVVGTKMKDVLVRNGYQLIWNEWHEGHSWGNWRAHLDIALKYFYPDSGQHRAER